MGRGSQRARRAKSPRWGDAGPPARLHPSARNPIRGGRMSNLTVVAYDDVATAQEVVQTLARLQQEHNIVIEDIVVAERKADGKVKLHQTQKLGAAGATGGALWGGLIGLLFLAPLLGMAVGAASGGMAGAFTDIGVDDDMMKQIGEQLEPGKAAVFALPSQGNIDKVLPELAQFRGKVLQSSLSTEAEQQLRQVVEGQKSGATA